MLICEIFKSIQGEGIQAGLPFIFVRLSGCNLNCTYCDTEYSKKEFIPFEIKDILKSVSRFNINNLLITGGEPLVQDEVYILMKKLLKHKYKVSLETNGSILIDKVPKKVHIILDLKTPASGMNKKNNLNNLKYLKKTDEIKFVVTGRKDFLWSIKQIKKFNLEKKFIVLISPVRDNVSFSEISDWILNSGLNLKLNLQIHKIIWPGTERKR
ncbi:MAG: radical SAM protein [bacterium]|nr:radical SAM protein [bacterium]